MANWQRWGPYLPRDNGERSVKTTRHQAMPGSISTAMTAGAWGASHQTGWTALVARLLEDVPDRPVLR